MWVSIGIALLVSIGIPLLKRIAKRVRERRRRG
jgi:hypothetical protein